MKTKELKYLGVLVLLLVFIFSMTGCDMRSNPVEEVMVDNIEETKVIPLSWGRGSEEDIHVTVRYNEDRGKAAVHVEEGEITLKAKANPGYEFHRWAGRKSSDENPWIFKPDNLNARLVFTAVFKPVKEAFFEAILGNVHDGYEHHVLWDVEWGAKNTGGVPEEQTIKFTWFNPDGDEIESFPIEETVTLSPGEEWTKMTNISTGILGLHTLIVETEDDVAEKTFEVFEANLLPITSQSDK